MAAEVSKNAEPLLLGQILAPPGKWWAAAVSETDKFKGVLARLVAAGTDWRPLSIPNQHNVRTALEGSLLGNRIVEERVSYQRTLYEKAADALGPLATDGTSIWLTLDSGTIIGEERSYSQQYHGELPTLGAFDRRTRDMAPEETAEAFNRIARATLEWTCMVSKVDELAVHQAMMTLEARAQQSQNPSD